MVLKTMRITALAAFCFSVGSAQTQTQPTYVRDLCVKVAPGKNAEYSAFMRDVTAKMQQARIDAGEMAFWLLARAVVPAGTSAKCDYHSVSGFNGFPPETPTQAQTDATLKKANVKMTAADVAAKRDSLSSLVSLDIWRGIDSIGGAAAKGSYFRLNYFKVKPGQGSEWAKLETTRWKPLVDAYIKAGNTASWTVLGLALPAGESLPYNALTVDNFKDWATLGRGIGAGELWPKVHPNLTMSEYMDQLAKVSDRHEIHVVQVVEVAGPKAAASGN
jgi:hypothetical protein